MYKGETRPKQRIPDIFGFFVHALKTLKLMLKPPAQDELTLRNSQVFGEREHKNSTLPGNENLKQGFHDVSNL